MRRQRTPDGEQQEVDSKQCEEDQARESENNHTLALHAVLSFFIFMWSRWTYHYT